MRDTVNEASVRPFGGSRRDALFDRETGTYFMPKVSSIDRAAVLAPPDEQAPLVAVVDTGVLAEHPLLKPRLVASADFTGAGPDDADGHGSEVAITLVLTSPNVRLLSAKVLAHDHAPEALQADRIAAGIRWAVDKGAREVNVCVGFLAPCGAPHAGLCASVREALDRGVFVLVAGEARCPAECDPRVFVVGEVKPDGDVHSRVPPTFVDGTFGRVRMIPWQEWTQEVQQSERRADGD